MIIELLDKIKNEIELMVPIPEKYTISRGNHNGFEMLVPNVLETLKNHGPIQFDYIVHLGHHFPDIDILVENHKYGIELKSRNNGAWVTNGNSVFESITGSDYDEIYLLFGSLYRNNNQIKVKYAPYWSVTTNISVTHSPRFSINMDATDSVFESSASYEKLRGSTDDEKILFLQEYLKENTKGAKWYVPQLESEVSPINLSEIEKENLNRIIVEVMLLYPQDIFKSVGVSQKIRSDYSRASEYIISTYFYYSSSFRDFFSAGGKWDYNNNTLPRVFKILHDNKEVFNSVFEEANQDFIEKCHQSWAELDIYLLSDNFKKGYLEVLDYLGQTELSNIVQVLPNQQLSSLLQ